MSLESLLSLVKSQPEKVEFNDVIACIEKEYTFTETAFTNGLQANDAGENNGSCKLFAFAKIHNLTQDQTLALFGTYYRDDVLKNPDGSDHHNIRQFIKFGFDKVAFNGTPLELKSN